MTKERLSLRARALRFLALREHSRAELARKLRRYTVMPQGADDEGADDDEAFSPSAEADSESSSPLASAAEIDAILDDFERRGWLSEARFVEATAHRLSKRYGARRVVATLKEKGVSAASIEEVKPYLKDQERHAARDALRRKFEGPPADAAARARQMRFLMARGFDYDVVRNVLNWNEEEVP